MHQGVASSHCIVHHSTVFITPSAAWGDALYQKPRINSETWFRRKKFEIQWQRSRNNFTIFFSNFYTRASHYHFPVTTDSWSGSLNCTELCLFLLSEHETFKPSMCPVTGKLENTICLKDNRVTWQQARPGQKVNFIQRLINQSNAIIIAMNPRFFGRGAQLKN